jgi:hypothetical protein
LLLERFNIIRILVICICLEFRNLSLGLPACPGQEYTMRLKLVHPLWTHLPSIAALVLLIAYLIAAGPLPPEVATHFGFNGQPDAYGSPWSVFGLNIGLSLFFIALSVFLDELWARQEKTKKFNWLSLIDDITVGAMAGISLGYLNYIREGAVSYGFNWAYFGLVFGFSVILAVVLELLRPAHPNSEALVARDLSGLKTELAQRLEKGSRFVYWDSQNPFYVTLLTIILPLVMITEAVFFLFNQSWAAYLLIIIGILLIIPFGGQRTLITRDHIIIRWGIIGIRVLNLKIPEIAAVEVHQFAPLKDFGGYGIRFNGEMTAYYFRGNRGVKITTAAGKKYLIGSDRPENLAAVIQTIIGKGR